MKQISIYELNKIKRLQEEIFEEEDDDYVDRRITSPKYRAIDRILNKYSETEKQELLDHIKWHNDHCVIVLKTYGWTIVDKDGNAL